MLRKAPFVDQRTPDQISRQTLDLLFEYLRQRDNDLPGSSTLERYNWPRGSDGGEAGRALVGVFAHYCGLIIDRVNRAPEKNFLAFLDLLGNSLIPPAPAQVPITFFLDAATTEGFVLTAGTQIQSDSGNGSPSPIVFETERDLWISNFDLQIIGKKTGNTLIPEDLTELIMGPVRKEENFQKVERLFDQGETFFFGLNLAAQRNIEENRPVSLFFFIDNPLYDSTAAGTQGSQAPRVIWQYSAGPSDNDWKPLVLEDGTSGLTQTGAVEFFVPSDFTRMDPDLFKSNLFWIRAFPEVGGVIIPAHQAVPLLKGVAINTVIARQAVTIRNEVVGSSNGGVGQIFNTFKKPVLSGEILEVLERQVTVSGQQGKEVGTEEWTQWQEVPDFYASGPLDRHYVVNREIGEIRFGDGRSGKIPPSGTRNIRMTMYQTGGGTAGNVAVGSLKTLLASNRRIDRAVNFVPATGGAEAEAHEALLDRAPKALRHRGRAVTDEDYEDLAKLASTEVVRAKCVSLIDLTQEPSKVITTVEQETEGAGKVSIIIVPRNASPKPLPNQALMHKVAAYLRDHSDASVALSVVGPLYLRVDITVQLKLETVQIESRVKLELQKKFAAFLHPLTGRSGQGWPFGRRPQNSDIYRLINTVAGINYVEALDIELSADERPSDCNGETVDCVARTGRYLIYSGQHTINTTIK